jgi:hypothetical protein
MARDRMGSGSKRTSQELAPIFLQMMVREWSFELDGPVNCFDIPNSIPNRVKIFRSRKTKSSLLNFPFVTEYHTLTMQLVAKRKFATLPSANI